MKIPPDVEHALELLEERRPCKSEDLLSSTTILIDFFKNCSLSEQAAFRQLLRPEHFGSLRGYATRMASIAVRRNSLEDLDRALIASALEGGRYDYRYTLITLCLLYHAALKLGANPDDLFRKAALLGDSDASKFLLNYLASDNKSLYAMRYKEGVDENGEFKFVPID
jgi:hypothetical protein